MSPDPVRNAREHVTDEHAERIGALAVALHLLGDRVGGSMSVYDVIAIADYIVTGRCITGDDE